MEIHELNTFSGTPGASDYLVTDNGSDTSKISIKAITDPLNARIDNIIAGPASSAEEVIDGRLGADGVTYSSIGDAIRGQFGKSIKADRVVNTDGTFVAPYNDLNTIPNQTVVTFVNRVPSNAPATSFVSNELTVMTYNYTTVSVGGAVQIAIDAGANMWVRYRVNNNRWSDWAEMVSKRNDKAVNTDATFAAPYNDFNTLPYGSIVTYVNYVPANSPVNTFPQGTFTVITYNYKNTSGIGGAVQIVVDAASNLYIRYKKSDLSWVGWNSITNRVELTIPALSAFDHIGIAGDSWSNGCVYTTANNYQNVNALRWGYIASKKYGFTPAIFASSGASTATWITRPDGLPALQAADAQDLYICALGINDHAQGMSIGNTGDMDDSSADSFYGYYGQIIRAIRTKAPNAKIAIATIPQYNASVDVSAYNTAIQNIAEHFGVALLDVSESEFFNSTVFTNDRQHNHLTAVGYTGMAEAIASMLSKSFSSNRDYWKYSMM